MSDSPASLDHQEAAAADDVLDEDAPPNVMTTSYGQNEDTISQKLAQYVSPIPLMRR